ncbi:MAG: CBASS cGAMP-activated phospholipase [Candidatus Cloacimonadia bacterium]
MEEKKKRFQILALDGGGIKGLYSAAVLAHIEKDLEIKIADHFDLIVGTSTGGIIALALGSGLRPQNIVKFYEEWGPEIFRDGVIPKVKQFYRNKYSNKGLQNALKKCLGDKKLGESTKRLVIPSFNVDENSVHLFKTPHHKRLKRDWKIPMWKVAMATTAAPTFFPIYKGINSLRLLDGGVWANNPSMVGIVEAKSLLNADIDSIHLLNLGTTLEVKKRSDKLNFGGLWQWKKDAVNLIMEGQSEGAYNQCRLLLGESNAYRLNPIVPKNLFTLDKLNVDKLMSKASSQSREFTPIFEERFMNHIAPDYKPLYPDKGEVYE